jgi:hypothetical protein
MKFGFFQLRATPIGRRADLSDKIWKTIYTENTMSSYREYMGLKYPESASVVSVLWRILFCIFPRDLRVEVKRTVKLNIRYKKCLRFAPANLIGSGKLVW